jgi:hypothetical protein
MPAFDFLPPQACAAKSLIDSTHYAKVFPPVKESPTKFGLQERANFPSIHYKIERATGDGLLTTNP